MFFVLHPFLKISFCLSYVIHFFKATMKWTTWESSTVPRRFCPPSDQKLREFPLRWTTTYQALVTTAPIRPQRWWRGPSCRECTHNIVDLSLCLSVVSFWKFENVNPHNCVSRRRYLTISAPPLIVPKDPPLPGPGHYDVRNHTGASKHPMPSAAFASTTERIPQNEEADMTPGPGNNKNKQINTGHFGFSLILFL